MVSAGYVFTKTLKALGLMVLYSIIVILLSPLILFLLLCLAGIMAYSALALIILFGLSYIIALLLNCLLHIPLWPAAIIIMIMFSLFMVSLILDDHPVSVPAAQNSRGPSLLTALVALCLFNSFHDHDC